jgi:hypothetical protein
MPKAMGKIKRSDQRMAGRKPPKKKKMMNRVHPLTGSGFD